MVQEVPQILEQFLNQLASEIRAKVPHATGRTASGIEVKMELGALKVKGKIIGPKYIETLETGRGPTRKKGGGGQTLQQSILAWLQTKSIAPAIRAGQKKAPTQEQLSWAIAVKIHNEGNKLFRAGGKSGVLSSVITENRIDAFVKVFNDRAALVILNDVVKNMAK